MSVVSAKSGDALLYHNEFYHFKDLHRFQKSERDLTFRLLKIIPVVDLQMSKNFSFIFHGIYVTQHVISFTKFMNQ